MTLPMTMLKEWLLEKDMIYGEVVTTVDGLRKPGEKIEDHVIAFLQKGNYFEAHTATDLYILPKEKQKKR